MFSGKCSGFLLTAMGALVTATGAEPENILWNGGFEYGPGSGAWGVERRTGPIVAELRHRGGYRSEYALNLVKPVASRLYKLGHRPGVWRLSFKARALDESGAVTATLTNLNGPDIRTGDRSGKDFQLTGEWQTCLVEADIRHPERDWFHVKFQGQDALVDEVMLNPPDAAPGDGVFMGAQAVEAGFRIPEITRVYVDGEDRQCALIVVNNTDRRQTATVRLAGFDLYEQAVFDRETVLRLEPREILQTAVPLETLGYGSYRLLARVKDGEQQGDALIGLLPGVPQDSLRRWGCNASLDPESLDFTIRMMRKLGMGFVSTLSTGRHVGRWHVIETEPGRYNFQPEVVQRLAESGIEPVPYLRASAVPVFYLDKSDDEIADAYARFVYEAVRAYGRWVRFFSFEDETERQAIFRERPELFPKMHRSAYRAVRRAARDLGDVGHPILANTNSVSVDWLGKMYEQIGPEYWDFISFNATHIPGWTERVLRFLASAPSAPPIFLSPAIGSGADMRPVSLISTRATGKVPSWWPWLTVKSAWMSRRWNSEPDEYAPVIHYGFYEIRVHDCAAYVPRRGWTALEYDNSPHAGFQAVVCMRRMIGDLRAVRPTTAADITQSGLKLPNAGDLEAYPFRNDTDAVVVLMPAGEALLDRPHRLSLPPDLELYDLFANRVELGGNGVYRLHAFPVYVKLAANRLDTLLSGLDQITAEAQQGETVTTHHVGPFRVDVDPGMPGLVRISYPSAGGQQTLVQGIAADPPLAGDVTISSQGNEFLRTIRLDCRTGHYDRSVALVVDRTSVQCSFYVRNLYRDKRYAGNIRLILGDALTGTPFIRLSGDGQDRATGVAGFIAPAWEYMREDRQLVEPAAAHSLGKGETLVAVKDRCELRIHPATTRNLDVEPEPELRLVAREGRAFLELAFDLKEWPGGNSSATARTSAWCVFKNFPTPD